MNALKSVPEQARDAVERIIRNPKFLASLLKEEVERLEEYARLTTNTLSYSENYDAWGNCVTVSDDCKGKAKLYKRVLKELSY